jgi:hypothetical protein
MDSLLVQMEFNPLMHIYLHQILFISTQSLFLIETEDEASYMYDL